ncbi:disease resistance protein RUN1-like isoform X3 [Gossypium hirsutum]|uniref:Disease resistance protein RUN1-like isoform X3 n=1 Tax=Gossypium hirsutum TaxID=3635 RepID=A0ABM3AXT6_GOSHI|nr:disease resistance protein RUN1-like isoform X3 [Gossypium hirsutum]
MASSSSSSTLMMHHVFLSFRGEDTRLNFTSHLLEALKSEGLDVFFDEEKLEKGEQLSQALSRAIAVSNISIIVLSADYASSKSCLVELSDIMIRKRSHGHTVIPIFYHVDPSNVRKIGGSFETSFKEHESKQPTDTVQPWKFAFAEIGTLKGWHIEGGKFDRPETEYIKDVVEYVIKKLTNIGFESASEELVGIEYQKNAILKLIKQKDCRVIGLWGMGGQGKTTLAEAVYKKFYSVFESRWFLQNVREEIKKQGKESLRKEFLSKLLDSNVDIGTPSIGSTLTQERLNKKKVLVLDDVDDSDQIDYMGVQYFGSGSKTIITSRDRQVLESGGADGTIHEVKGLNEIDSLQLFSTFAFKQLNPAVGFQDLSRRFVKYTQGNPLALKVLGSDLNKRSKSYWESKVEKLKDCPPEKKISEALKSSYDGLDLVEQNIFLDIACFFKGEPMERTKLILSGCYKGAECGINKLVDKCLINVSTSYWRYSTIWTSGIFGDAISMHDTLEEMGKDIVCQESKTLGSCSFTGNRPFQLQKFKEDP